ncbi:MAG: hypoxanthine phosphoribosyltransferase [Acidobacteria bacterium]|nr:hypoxanthine phosphoribosyltransferase [Acidobacteriota bacterium]
MAEDVGEVLIDEESIQRRVKELGAQISAEYAGKSPILVCILKGACLFHADLIRATPIDVFMDFIAVGSYGASTQSSGEVRILKDLDESPEGKDVILVEDILDTGLTLNYLISYIKSRHPNSLKVATLLSKPARRVVDVQVDYLGFEIPDQFVVGYGLDYAQRYRNLPYVAVLKTANQSSK